MGSGGGNRARMNEQKPHPEQARQQNVEMKNGIRRCVQEEKERKRGRGNGLEEAAAVPVMETMASFKLRRTWFGEEGPGVQEAVGGVEHPHGDKHSGGIRPGQVQARTPGDEGGPPDCKAGASSDNKCQSTRGERSLSRDRGASRNGSWGWGDERSGAELKRTSNSDRRGFRSLRFAFLQRRRCVVRWGFGGSHRQRAGQAEADQALRGDADLLAARNSLHNRTAAAAGECADAGTLAAAKDAAQDGANRRASPDLLK